MNRRVSMRSLALLLTIFQEAGCERVEKAVAVVSVAGALTRLSHLPGRDRVARLPGGRTARASTQVPARYWQAALTSHPQRREPVTNFRRSTRLYNIAVSHNNRLDADHDGSRARPTK
jgi:hypothetical protein